MYITRYKVLQPLSNQHYLLLNTLTGAIDLVDEHVKRILDGNILSSEVNSNLQRKLRRRGYIFVDSKEENQKIQEIEKIALDCYKKNNEDRKFVVALTLQCNFNCKYCFQNPLRAELLPKEHRISTMQPDMIGKILDIIQKKSENSILTLYGGEPLLDSQLLEYFFTQCQYRELKLNIITNGSRVDLLSDLLYSFKSIIRSFQITLDGVGKIHNERRRYKTGKPSFTDIIVGIKWILEEEIADVVVRVNVDDQNTDEIPKLVRFFKQHGWNKHKLFTWGIALVTDHTDRLRYPHLLREDELIMQLNKVWPTWKSHHLKLESIKIIEALIRIFEQEHEHLTAPRFLFCEANDLNQWIFSPDGLIYPCAELLGLSEYAIGRYYPEFEYFPSTSKWEQRDITTNALCRNCIYRFLCGGGCAAASALHLGSVKEPYEPYCRVVKSTVQQYLRTKGEEILTRHGQKI